MFWLLGRRRMEGDRQKPKESRLRVRHDRIPSPGKPVPNDIGY